MMTTQSLWQRFKDNLCVCPSIGLTLDVSRMDFEDGYIDGMSHEMHEAFEAMDALEAGSIANPDENRMVGHYWLREPTMAPSKEIRESIERTNDRVRAFVASVHDGKVKAANGSRFSDVLVVGIGGSALGPQFVADALGDPQTDKLGVHFFDNTDPDGVDRTLRALGDRLATTLSVVISKSGGTPETRNGMLAAKAAYEAAGTTIAPHAVAITGVGSKLDKVAEAEGWLLRVPMWDWVGGRTSETAAVGLLPAALQGLDIDAILAGAAACDAVTRKHDLRHNPAALLAIMWHHATGGRGEKDMVVLPYKDRLLLFSRYLQQLVMESLGKELDLDGKTVHQGIAVYGNKGSTDQHAYVQQLREGVNNFFAVFIRVLEDGGGASGALEVEPGVTAGDYLDGFWQGTRAALHGNGRESMTLTVPRVDAFHVGVLIALFERAVGLYATLVNINAYHQPGVEAGKQAAAAVLALQAKIVEHLSDRQGHTVEQVAEALGVSDDVEAVYHVLEHLVANGRANTARGEGGFDATYTL